MRRLLAASAALTASVAMLGAVHAPSAAALPMTCYVQTTTTAASATCRTGTGLFRVVARCERSGFLRTVYGAWTRPPGTSTATCNIGEQLHDARVELRSAA
jgi:hypothetical protein